MTDRTYSIIRSRRRSQKTVETIVATGLSWADADSQRNAMAEADRAAHPTESSWTRDVFVVQLEK